MIIVGNSVATWQVITCDHSVHMVPCDDLKPHWMDQNGTCWCHPTENTEYADAWTHNSLDLRETYEQGRKLH